MPVDFYNLLDDEAEVALHPRDIFLTLGRSREFSFPRDIQTEVMKRWFELRDYRDIVIKLNVGSGKTLVGLLLLQSSLNERKGPALYVSPNNQLLQQVMQEAKALGIDVTDDPRNASYSAAEMICAVNIHKLFNGKSVFGVGPSQIDIGSVVIDDAHACVATLTQQFRIHLAKEHGAYHKIFKAISEDLKAYNTADFLDISAGNPYTYMEVPFWSWEAHQGQILQALHDFQDDEELRFTYPLLRGILQQCRCVVGGQHLEIEPYFPATDLIQSFRRAKRRIYMTATLADDSVIVTHFGADPNERPQLIVPSSSQSMGERMILMPQELNSDLTSSDVRGLLAKLATKVNVVVIVPSGQKTEDWADDAEVLVGNGVAAGIEELRKRHRGLTVLVNRYDGIDLPGDACRVLAIAGLPEVSSFADLIDSEVLSGTNVNLRRQIERVEQGMGRGVRSNDDYCVVVLLGPKLIGRLRSPRGKEMLTPATQAQLNLSHGIARQLNEPSIEEIEHVILQCLNRDPGWMKVSKTTLLGLDSDDELSLNLSQLAMREAFDSARANEYDKAISILDKAVDAECEPQVKALLLSRKAAFQHSVDANGAQKTLAAAHRLDPGVMKPMHGTTYKKLEPATEQQAKVLISNHHAELSDPTAKRLLADELCSDLQFTPGTSDKFEAAVNKLAWFIGIRGQRPEKDYNEGPDNLWALPNGQFLVIECKNGVTSSNGIAKKHVGQLSQSIDWFSDRYPASTSIPIVIHKESMLAKGASRCQGMRVIASKQLEKLRDSLNDLAKQLGNPDVASSTTEVASRLVNVGLNYNAFVDTFSVKPKANRK